MQPVRVRPYEKQLGTEQAIRVYDADTKGWHAGAVSQVKADSDGDEWVLTDKGINLIGKKRIECDFPFRYMTEKIGRKWLISSDGQLAEFTAKGVRFMDRAPGVSRVYQMKAISDTLLTVGTDAGLLLVRIPDGKMKMVDIRSAAQPVADVLSVFKDSSRRLWMFTPSAGVVMYELTDGRCTTLLPSVSRDLSETAHPFVYEDERGLLQLAQEPVSLETPVGEEEDAHLEDFIQDEEAGIPVDEAGRQLLRRELMSVLKSLTPREERVITLRFGLDDGRPRTLEELGKEFNVTRERIRQIEAKALRNLRHPSRAKRLRDYLE